MILDIQHGFDLRTGIPPADPALCARICASYVLASAQERAPHYQVGNEWIPIYRDHMGEFMAALHAADYPHLGQMLANFYRERLSAGLHGFDLAMVQTYMTPDRPASAEQLKRYMDFILKNIDLLQRSVGPLDVGSMQRPDFGNPYGYALDGQFISFGAEMHYYFQHRIRQWLGQVPEPRVVELGGGFGGVAYFLIKNIPGLKYYCFDLPENMALQSYYLASCFPERRVVLYGETDLSRLSDNDGDIFVLPNFAMDYLPADFCNLSFNSYSLAEMEPEAIDNYVKILCRSTRDIFYHINHAVICKMSADLFPVDRDKFELLQRAPANWGGNNDRVTDIHEYVYRRRLTR